MPPARFANRLALTALDWCLMGFLLALQALDVLTTWAGVSAGAIELNPVGVEFLAGGLRGLIGAKLLATTLAVGFAAVLWRHGRHDFARIGLAVPCAVMVAAVAWNAWTLAQVSA